MYIIIELNTQKQFDTSTEDDFSSDLDLPNPK